MIETNPGPGAGILLAYWMFSKDKITRDSAPGALIIHFFGGIHEIFFPYVLMNPLLLLATIGGSVSALFYYSALGLGLAGPPSPGSIIAYLAMAPKGSTLAVILGVLLAGGVSFAIASPIVKLSNGKSGTVDLEDAKNMVTHVGGLNSVAETTLNLPKIKGGKKLAYTQFDMPMTAIEDFGKLGESDPFFKKLDECCKAHRGLWNAEAEKLIFERFNVEI